ncbi:hypothetical protein MKEN_00950000 [Mycena kentingensis (nom. inval.)]|nr:hypothetical protein MKEN_00950000 [Mycena kentingensis (nom. inval.)]
MADDFMTDTTNLDLELPGGAVSATGDGLLDYVGDGFPENGPGIVEVHELRAQLKTMDAMNGSLLMKMAECAGELAVMVRERDELRKSLDVATGELTDARAALGNADARVAQLEMELAAMAKATAVVPTAPRRSWDKLGPESKKALEESRFSPRIPADYAHVKRPQSTAEFETVVAIIALGRNRLPQFAHEVKRHFIDWSRNPRATAFNVERCFIGYTVPDWIGEFALEAARVAPRLAEVFDQMPRPTARDSPRYMAAWLQYNDREFDACRFIDKFQTLHLLDCFLLPILLDFLPHAEPVSTQDKADNARVLKLFFNIVIRYDQSKELFTRLNLPLPSDADFDVHRFQMPLEETDVDDVARALSKCGISKHRLAGYGSAAKRYLTRWLATVEDPTYVPGDELAWMSVEEVKDLLAVSMPFPSSKYSFNKTMPRSATLPYKSEDETYIQYGFLKDYGKQFGVYPSPTGWTRTPSVPAPPQFSAYPSAPGYQADGRDRSFNRYHDSHGHNGAGQPHTNNYDQARGGYSKPYRGGRGGDPKKNFAPYPR